jgi:hypothetical protein
MFGELAEYSLCLYFTKLTWFLVTSTFGLKKFATGIAYTNRGTTGGILHGYA